jgi:hypothetical protein
MVCLFVRMVDARGIRSAVLDLNLTAFDDHIIHYQQIFPAFFPRIV